MCNNIKNGKQFYRAKEIVELYGIGLSTVYYYCKIGKLSPIKMSARVTVYSAEDVHNLINDDEVA